MPSSKRDSYLLLTYILHEALNQTEAGILSTLLLNGCKGF